MGGHVTKFGGGVKVGAAESLAEALAAAYERAEAHRRAWGDKAKRPRLKGRERVDGRYAEAVGVTRG